VGNLPLKPADKGDLPLLAIGSRVRAVPAVRGGEPASAGSPPSQFTAFTRLEADP